MLGGVVAIIHSREKNLWHRVSLNPPWRYLIAFVSITIGAILLSLLVNHQLVKIFESFYRYGYLVFGGGQVVIPVMFSDLVEINSFMTTEEFLTGYGLVQAMPGPMFSFSAYAGGPAGRATLFTQISSALVAGLAIFLPGLLLIYFVYPIWEKLKQIRGIKVSLKGINAIAGGLITVSALIIMQRSGFAWDNLLVMAGTLFLLSLKKIPAPFIVILVICLGFMIG